MNNKHRRIIQIMVIGFVVCTLWSCHRADTSMKRKASEFQALIKKGANHVGRRGINEDAMSRRDIITRVSAEKKKLDMELELAQEIGKVMDRFILLRPSLQGKFKTVAKRVLAVVATGLGVGAALELMNMVLSDLPQPGLAGHGVGVGALRILRGECHSNASSLVQEMHGADVFYVRLDLVINCFNDQKDIVTGILRTSWRQWYDLCNNPNKLEQCNVAVAGALSTVGGYLYSRWGIGQKPSDLEEKLTNRQLNELKNLTISALKKAQASPLDKEIVFNARKKLRDLFIETALLTNEIQDFDNPDLMDQLEKLCHKISAEENKVVTEDSMRVKTLSICAESVEAALKQLKRRSCNRNQVSTV